MLLGAGGEKRVYLRTADWRFAEEKSSSHQSKNSLVEGGIGWMRSGKEKHMVTISIIFFPPESAKEMRNGACPEFY